MTSLDTLNFFDFLDRDPIDSIFDKEPSLLSDFPSELENDYIPNEDSSVEFWTKYLTNGTYVYVVNSSGRLYLNGHCKRCVSHLVMVFLYFFFTPFVLSPSL